MKIYLCLTDKSVSRISNWTLCKFIKYIILHWIFTLMSVRMENYGVENTTVCGFIQQTWGYRRGDVNANPQSPQMDLSHSGQLAMSIRPKPYNITFNTALTS